MGERNTVVNSKPVFQEQCLIRVENPNGKNDLLVPAVEDSSLHTWDT